MKRSSPIYLVQRSSILLLLLFIVTVSTGCGRAINRSAERHIRDLLPDLIGNAKQYRVHVDGDEIETAHGKLASVKIDGTDVQVSNGLLIDNLHLVLRDVAADLDHQQLKKVGSAHFEAVIGEAALDEYLAGESPVGETLRNVRISLHTGLVTISGERMVLGVGVPFKAYGPLRVAGPHRIELDPTKLVVVGIPISGPLLRYLKSKFESAIDLSTLPVPVSIETVQTTNKKLILTGSPSISALLEMRHEGNLR